MLHLHAQAQDELSKQKAQAAKLAHKLTEDVATTEEMQKELAVLEDEFDAVKKQRAGQQVAMHAPILCARSAAQQLQTHKPSCKHTKGTRDSCKVCVLLRIRFWMIAQVYTNTRRHKTPVMTCVLNIVQSCANKHMH